MLVNAANEHAKVIGTTEVKYMMDGTLYTGRGADTVMILTEDDLEPLAEALNPGSIAFTAGYSGKWQLNARHEWVDCSEGGGSVDIVGRAIVGDASLTE